MKMKEFLNMCLVASGAVHDILWTSPSAKSVLAISKEIAPNFAVMCGTCVELLAVSVKEMVLRTWKDLQFYRYILIQMLPKNSYPSLD